jgi:hypothetical protein
VRAWPLDAYAVDRKVAQLASAAERPATAVSSRRERRHLADAARGEIDFRRMLSF